MRTAQPLTYKGRTQSIKDWAAELGVSNRCMINRASKMRNGKLTERKCFAPGQGWNARDGKSIEFRGRIMKMMDVAKELGITVNCLRGRLFKFRHGKLAQDELFRRGNKSGGSKPAVVIDVDGKPTRISELARKFKVDAESIRYRLTTIGVEGTLEWLRDPFRRQRGTVFVNGVGRKVEEATQALGLTVGAFYGRRARGWSEERILLSRKHRSEESVERARDKFFQTQHRKEMLALGVLV